MTTIAPHEIYVDLFKINAKNYLTTNYDYAFKDSIVYAEQVRQPIEEHSSEDVYSLRRLKEIYTNNGVLKNFWQIHVK